MNWSSTSDILVGLMIIYLCVGVLVGVGVAICFIREEVFGQDQFVFCCETVIYYGPAAVYLLYRGIKKLIKYLWTRDYRSWYNKQMSTYQAWVSTRKRMKKQLKDFKAKQKK